MRVFLHWGMGLIIVVSGFGQSNPVEARSLLGNPLTRPILDAATAESFAAKLEQAKDVLEGQPLDVEAWIWVGRRQAYLGRYQEAIATFSKAMAIAPSDARLFRHRGHRYLTTRQLPLAIADFEEAARLVEGKSDEVEPDGLPNAQNIPTSTLQTNIYYHLGLAYYLTGQFQKARMAYVTCLALSKNDDMWCATAYWHYLTLRQLGEVKEAESLLGKVTPAMTLIENEGYFQLLNAYKHPESLGALLSEKQENALQSTTVSYGIAQGFLFQGDREASLALKRKILESNGWAAFGYLAAEADLARDLERNP